jgi:hypothetical protein
MSSLENKNEDYNDSEMDRDYQEIQGNKPTVSPSRPRTLAPSSVTGSKETHT